MGSDLVRPRVLLSSEKLSLFSKSNEWALWEPSKEEEMGSGLVRACWIRICSGSGGSLEGTWGSPKLWSNILLGVSFFWSSCWETSWGRSKEGANSVSGTTWKVLAGNRGDRGGSGGIWVGSGGDGEGGGISSSCSEPTEHVLFSLWSLGAFVVGVAAADSEVGAKVDGMPLFGGKGGDGLGNNVPLFIAGKKREQHLTIRWLYNALKGQPRAQNYSWAVLTFQAKNYISWLCHSLDYLILKQNYPSISMRPYKCIEV